MEDTEADIKRKIKKSYCPEKSLKENPVIEYFQYFIMNYYNEWTMVRSDQNGGNKHYKTMDEIKADFVNGELHPVDLKQNFMNGLNRILEPVRKHFENNLEAKRLLAKVKEYQKMREEEVKKSE